MHKLGPKVEAQETGQFEITEKKAWHNEQVIYPLPSKELNDSKYFIHSMRLIEIPF